MSNPNSTAKAWLYWAREPSGSKATIMSMEDSMIDRFKRSVSARSFWVALWRLISSFNKWFASSAKVARICSRTNATRVRKSERVTCTAAERSWKDNVIRIPTSTISSVPDFILTSLYGGLSPSCTLRMSSCNTAWSSS